MPVFFKSPLNWPKYAQQNFGGRAPEPPRPLLFEMLDPPLSHASSFRHVVWRRVHFIGPDNGKWLMPESQNKFGRRPMIDRRNFLVHRPRVQSMISRTSPVTQALDH